MIDRILIKNHLSFEEVELKFKRGLSVFTGVSGAGKSVLMGAIMSVFGLSESDAKLIEADVDFEFDMSEFGIENEALNTFKMLKQTSTRYFINSQSISKKSLSAIASEHIKYLSAKSVNEFENEKFLRLLDELAKSDEHNDNLNKLREIYAEFKSMKSELERMNDEENRIEELKEFAKFEIEKIRSINPKIGEFDELMEIKKRLSKKDKIEQAWSRADRVFELEHSVIEALNISDIDSSFFEDAMNSLRVAKDGLNIDELDEIDVESVLDRIEALNSILKRYGSEEEAISVLKKREAELERYENISFQKHDIEIKFKEINRRQNDLCLQISKQRSLVLKQLEDIINSYLAELYMQSINLKIESKNTDELGCDSIVLTLNNTSLNKLSSGEINRLRLAFIASQSQITSAGNGVIILDEIDANLSGKEAMSIANVLSKIAKFYQIFAISHQPQLSSKASSHFLVEKSSDRSVVKELNDDERVNELARMISGEHISREAIDFAKGLLKS